ncbi:hypothetical protein BCR33DRAFT_717634 [Rhizoclosmatium globosum]|uniref:Uncharacterized protein n=1 Tax=Rhizoclosmatium globosum TaxID=329046 RepID=A0A1Y2C8R6_9FUNG|nr:hypothetical protein BCR33DRAFT_717634 [Rhizoclosmatium globosum]|eukprot:ORY43420.1 hypothetical protein BCR33DRAFT_717634 [Rhizoclosmatium globosum]
MNETVLNSYSASLNSVIPLSIASILSFAGFLYLLWFIAAQEIPKRSMTNGEISSQPESSKSIIAVTFTPLNNALAVMALSLTGYYLTSAIKMYPSGLSFDVNNALISVFLAFSESSYVYYAWKRGIFVVRHVFPRFGEWVAKSIIIVPPLVLVQAFPSIVLCYMKSRNHLDFYTKPYLDANDLLTGFSGLVVVIFDLILLTAFIKFMKKTKVIDSDIVTDEKLVIVARYGIGAISLSLSMLFCYGIYLVFTVLAFYTISQLLVGSMLILLLRMKVLLFQQEEEERKILEIRITKQGRASVESKAGEGMRTSTATVGTLKRGLGV